jgi:hypothetical protein
MAVSFPSITPTNRSFSAPIYPVTVYRSQSGVSVRRLWASQPSNARLSLTFSNIADADAADILTCYNNALGSVDTLSLPSTVFNGAETALSRYLSQTGTILNWRFADDTPPKVDSVVPGRSSVSLELIASLDYS